MGFAWLGSARLVIACYFSAGRGAWAWRWRLGSPLRQRATFGVVLYGQMPHSSSDDYGHVYGRPVRHALHLMHTTRGRPINIRGVILVRCRSSSVVSELLCRRRSTAWNIGPQYASCCYDSESLPEPLLGNSSPQRCRQAREEPSAHSERESESFARPQASYIPLSMPHSYPPPASSTPYLQPRQDDPRRAPVSRFKPVQTG